MTSTTKKERDYTLSSVRNALKILNNFNIEQTEKKLTDIAREMNLSKSSVSRLLKTLEAENFIAQDPDTKRYRLGLSVLSLSGVISSNFNFLQDAAPILAKLTEYTGETSHLSIIEGNEVVYLRKVDCSHPIRLFTHIGSRNPIHCTSSGKILLAYQNPNEIDKVINNGLTNYTPTTITDPTQLRETLSKIRTDGYATSYEEYIEGVASCAAPLRNYNGKVFASISCTGPIQRINHYTISKYIGRVKEAAEEISEIIGFR